MAEGRGQVEATVVFIKPPDFSADWAKLFAALLIDITGGRIESHFQIFGVLALLAFYRDWRVLITASAVMAIHHGVFGVLAPHDIYGVDVIQPWRWMEHTGWVVVEDIFLIVSITQSLKEMQALAERQASLETVNARIELQVGWRTAELEQSRKLLSESEANLRKIFDAMPDIITINRLRDSSYVNVNVAFEESGFTRAEALHASGPELRKMLDRRPWETYLARLRAEGTVRNLETELHFKQGQVPVLVSGALIELDSEPCSVTTIRDVTRLKETERALVAAREAAMAASRAKSEFLASMSHEIRTPMNAILGMTELLEETPLNAEQKRFLSIIGNNGDARLVLINDILDLAKIEAGRLILEQIDFDLEDLTDRVVQMLSLRAHAKGLELAVYLPPGVPRSLCGDPLRLRQILINLIGNAIKFTETGQVLLTVEPDGESDDPGALRFTISDTGIGIAEDKLDTVFADFTQADSSTTRRFGGTGLGLAITKRLVDLMNGQVSVESKLGVGSAFHFTARFEVRSTPRVVAQSTGVPTLSATRALIVDDNATNRLILCEMLASRGAEVSEAVDGPEGLALLERARSSANPFGLMLLDSRMPGMDGFQVAPHIKANGYPAWRC
jgi:two-component system, sensor histidine kinase and response regulator